MHDGIRRLKEVCDKEGLTLTEASMRWLMHHSILQEGDAIIFGAKRLDQLERNVLEARRGPLSGEVLEVIEGLWDFVSEREVEGKKNEEAKGGGEKENGNV